ALRASFVILAETTALAQPSEGALDHPALGKGREPLLARWPVHDLQLPLPERPSDDPERALIDAIGEDGLQSRAAGSVQLREHKPSSVGVLDVGRMHDHGPDHSERVNDNMSFAP